MIHEYSQHVATPPPCVILAEEVWGSGLHAARCLGRAHVPVYIAAAGRGAALYGRSRYCEGAEDFVFGNHASFCADVRSWVERVAPSEARVPLLPLSDRLVECLLAGQNVFPPHFRLGVASADVTTPLLDKASSMRLAQQAGLNVPNWVVVSSHENLQDMRILRFPVVVRPTRWSTAGSTYFKLAVYYDHDRLVSGVSAMLDQGAEIVAQDYVVVPDDAVEFAILWRSSDRSKTAICTGRKRRQAAAEGGVMVWGESVELPAVREAALRFLDETGFTGLGGIEFIRSDNALWFIEFNPRLEAIHFLASQAGIDTVLMAYRELALDELPTAIPRQRPAAAWVGSAALARLRSNPSDWGLIARDRWEFQRSSNRVRAVWSWNDPVPALALGTRLVYRGGRSVLHRKENG